MLVTDVDGCILDWHQGFIAFCKSKGHNIDPTNDRSDYNMSKWFEDMDTATFVELVTEFNNSDHSNRLLPYKDSVKWLTKIAQERNVAALTSFGDNPDQIAAREKILNALFPNVFKRVIVLPLNCSKHQALQMIQNECEIDLFVEDCSAHAQSGIDLGIRTVLLDKTYNRLDSPAGVIRVVSDEPWRNIYEWVL